MTNRLILGMTVLGLTGNLAFADLLVDRGLPTDNLNNAAGANRSNVAWAFASYTSANYWVVGDTFANTSSQTWAINSIRMWTVGRTDTAILRGGISGSTIGVITDATYANPSASLYQGSSGSYITMHQIDFAVNITLAPGQIYNFFLDGSGNIADIYVPFAHASNAALSDSPQDGADNTMLLAKVVNGVVELSSVQALTSLGNGWDKASDLNVQVFGSAVPDGTNTLLLSMLGLSGLALFAVKKNRLPTTN